MREAEPKSGKTGENRRWFSWEKLALLLVAVLALGWGLRRFWTRSDPSPDPPTSRSLSERTTRPDDTEPAAPSAAAVAPTASPADVVAPRPSPGVTTREAARATPVDDADPCTEAPEEHRDRLDEVVNARLLELQDRGRLALSNPATSPALREALIGFFSRGDSDLTFALAAEHAPDRMADGFDHAAAIALGLAVRAERNDRDPHAAIALSARLAPNDPAPFVLAAIGGMNHGDAARVRSSLDEAFNRDREEPSIALELAYALLRTTQLTRANEAVGAYLEVYPSSAVGRRLRALIERRLEGVGDASLLHARGVSVLASRALPVAMQREILSWTADALDDAARATDLPRRQELTVLVHRDHASLLRAMCGASWTLAAFDGVLHLDAEVWTNPRMAREEREAVVRHECMHATLHDVPWNAPFWLDEGVAQWFAARADPSMSASITHLVRDHTFIPFGSLNGAFMEIEDPDDARLAYHQSLAMIDWLVSVRGPRGVPELIQTLRASPDSANSDAAAVLSDVGRRRFDGEVMLQFLASRAR